MFEVGNRVSWDHSHAKYGAGTVLRASAAGGHLGTVVDVHDDETFTVELDSGTVLVLGKFELVKVEDD